jgi:hypothetical protein
MVADYASALVAAYLILLACMRRTLETRAMPAFRTGITRIQVPGWLTTLYIFTIGLGSTVFYLGSRAYVYHEAILCGVSFSLWSTWCALNSLQDSRRRWSWLAVIFGLLAIHARPPIGLFALTFVVAVSVVRALRAWRFSPLVAAAAAVLAIASFNGVSYLKFRTFEGCPLRLNVQYTPEKLAVLGNKNFHVSNLRFNSAAYLFIPSASIRREFPFIFLEFIDRKQYPESRMAYRDATLAIPYAMPSLTLLAVAGVVLLRRSAPTVRDAITLLWLSALPLTLAMLTAVAVTQRYTGDFCVFLIPAAAAGTVAIASLTSRWRLWFVAAIAAATFVATLLQFAITLHNQRALVWGVPEPVRAEYQRWQSSVDRWLK